VVGSVFVSLLPSPKSQAYWTMVAPPAALDGVPLKFTVSPGSGLVGEKVKLAVAPPPTVTVALADAD
jgi:hypothetical protein